MDEIILTEDGVQLTKQVEVMGSTEPYEKEMSYGELNENYNLQLDLHQIEPVTDNNGEFAVRLQLQSDQTETVEPSSEAFEDIPPVPDVQREEISEQRRPFYDRLKDPKMQPYDIRRVIYEEGELTQRELKAILQDQGHVNIKPGKNHGSVGMTLVVLDEVTNEIERHGRGEEKTIKWVGAE